MPSQREALSDAEANALHAWVRQFDPRQGGRGLGMEPWYLDGTIPPEATAVSECNEKPIATARRRAFFFGTDLWSCRRCCAPCALSTSRSSSGHVSSTSDSSPRTCRKRRCSTDSTASSSGGGSTTHAPVSAHCPSGSSTCVDRAVSPGRPPARGARWAARAPRRRPLKPEERVAPAVTIALDATKAQTVALATIADVFMDPDALLPHQRPVASAAPPCHSGAHRLPRGVGVSSSRETAGRLQGFSLHADTAVQG